jgi:hypothetical protein
LVVVVVPILVVVRRFRLLDIVVVSRVVVVIIVTRDGSSVVCQISDGSCIILLRRVLIGLMMLRVRSGCRRSDRVLRPVCVFPE